MNELPSLISNTFLITVIATVGFVYFGVKGAKHHNANAASMMTAVFVLVWLFAISIMAMSEVFIDFAAVPPRFLMVILPPLLVLIVLFSVKSSRDYIIQMPITTLTYIHIVRVPVEIVLWWLAGFAVIPELMTFEGINYDILIGISAPFVAIFMVGLRSKSEMAAVIWNVAGIILLLNIVIHALLSAPLPFQTLAFDQPNIAVFYFPYVLLPGFIVPAVLFSHVASILKLLEKEMR